MAFANDRVVQKSLFFPHKMSHLLFQTRERQAFNSWIKKRVRSDGSGLGISLHPLPGLTLGWHQLPTRAGVEYLCREKRNFWVSCSFPKAFIWSLNLRKKRGGGGKKREKEETKRLWGKGFGVFLVLYFGSAALGASAKGGDDARILRGLFGSSWSSSASAPHGSDPRGTHMGQEPGSETPGSHPGARERPHPTRKQNFKLLGVAKKRNLEWLKKV